MKNVQKVLTALGSVFRCHVCFHDYDGRIIAGIGPQPLYHCNPACALVRETRKGFLLCCDMEAKASREWLTSLRSPVFKCCHAGLWELAAPVFNHDVLTGAMFLGPFRSVALPDSAPPLLRQDGSGFVRELESARRILPALDRQAAADLVVFAELAAEQIALAFSTGNALTAESPLEERVRYFIDREFRREIYLADLAKFLGVGEIRVCQLLRRHFGTTFSELLNRRRIEHARYLLKDSRLKMATVSSECGFADPGYFFRIFRRLNGTTPGEYRHRTQPKNVSGSNLLA